MRRISEILTLLGILILFGSCKKDIEIDYHTVAPLYVIEASVTNDGMKARVSRTNAMGWTALHIEFDHAEGANGQRLLLHPEKDCW